MLYDDVIVTIPTLVFSSKHEELKKMETSLDSQIKASLELQEKYEYVVFSVAERFWFLSQ